MRIRDELEQDRDTVYQLISEAFGQSDEARLVDELRRRARPMVSLVAEADPTDGDADGVVGHIFFSPVTLESHPNGCLMGLAPMAVIPRLQRRGVGSALVKAGLERCRELGAGAVVVLGHPEYYPRFGFKPSTEFGFGCEYDVPPEVFLTMELKAGYLDDAQGKVRYHGVFASL